MLESDDIWNDVRPFMNANNDKLFVNLRETFTEKEYQEVNFPKVNWKVQKALLHIAQNWWKKS